MFVCVLSVGTQASSESTSQDAVDWSGNTYTVSLLHIIHAVSKISLTEPWFPAEAIKSISLSTGSMGKKKSAWE